MPRRVFKDIPAAGCLGPGSRAVLICEHGEVQFRLTVVQVEVGECRCGGPLHLCRIDDGDHAGTFGDFCAGDLRPLS
jgi:hypothetical protein